MTSWPIALCVRMVSTPWPCHSRTAWPLLVYVQTQGILQAKQPLYQLCYVSGFSAIFKFIHTWIPTHTLGNVVKVQLLRPSGETAGLEGGLPDTGIQIISQLRVLSSLSPTPIRLYYAP